ncbi:hypothetical protein OEZ85_012756 [Tetradesmus obliquus]|uniref:AsmA-like C-terminal domain-containing protein n=1 Tax=Tetradesmus obliquus TaxID=3088 RepID=A0ABY8U4J8_TETOB|nr:hypothetical protein OEZ85_012756 [Tetradesmus obliquus]
MAGYLTGAFKGRLVIPLFEEPRVDVACEATVSLEPTGNSFQVAASATGRMAIKGFPFIMLRTFKGMLRFKTTPPAVTAAALKVEGEFFGNNIGTDMVFVPDQGQFSIEIRVDKLSLQDTLRSIGINLNLGNLNMEVRDALIQMPKFDLQSKAAGMLVQGRFTWKPFGFTGPTIDTDLRYSLMPSGMELYTSLDLSPTAFSGDLGFTLFGQSRGIRITIDPNNPNFLAGILGDELAKIFTGGCTKDSYERGVGDLPQGCPDGQEFFRGL